MMGVKILLTIRATRSDATTAVMPRTRRNWPVSVWPQLRWWPSLLFLLPALSFLSIFVFVPAVYVVYLSFFKWNLLSNAPRFVGLTNYVHLLQDKEFQAALLHTALLGTGMLVVTLPAGLGLALLVDQKLRGWRLYRTVLFMPYVIPLVASGLVWTLIFSRNNGLMDHLLHMPGLDWLGSGRMALLAVFIASLWQYLGYYVLVFLAGLQAVPQSLMEAVFVDGGGRWTAFRTVTLPFMTPTLFFTVVVGIIQSLQMFDQVYVMTDGGPDGATTTLVYYIFNRGFQMYNIGIATAASVVLLILLATLTAVQLILSKRWVMEE